MKKSREYGMITFVMMCISVLSTIAVKANPVQWSILDGGNGHYYEYIEPQYDLNWDDARNIAESLTFQGCSGHLATIHSMEENSFILDVLSNTSNVKFWIGGFQPSNSSEPDGDWQWVTGELWTFTNWDSGEPNNWQNQDAVVLRKDWEGRWDDGHANVGKAFIVEYAVPEPATATILFVGVGAFLRRRCCRSYRVSDAHRL